MNIPRFLRKGDVVAIVSPAGFIEQSYIDYAVRLYESWGLRVLVGRSALNKHSIYAGTDCERISDMQQMLDNVQVKAIFCSRGGYGSVRIVDSLDFSIFMQSPKWIVGFSDITIFHALLNNKLTASLHSAMPKNFTSASTDAIETIRKILFGEAVSYTLENHILNRKGRVEAELIGGNLSILYSLRATKFDYNYTGKILLIEDLNERFYHIDRMLKNLKYGGVFDQISGLIVGGMTDMYDGASAYGKDVYEIINENIADYSFPVCYNAPAGHFNDNRAFLIGSQYKLTVSTSCTSIENLWIDKTV